MIITGTGRSGTGTFAKLLGGHHEFRASYLVDKYLRGPDCQSLSRSLERRISAIKDLHQNIDAESFIDSSNLYIHLIDAVFYLNPDAKFILCTRNGKDFVRSSITRNWHEHGLFGSVPPLDDPFYESWENMNPLQRNAWIWAYRNRVALGGLAMVPKDQKLIVKIEKCGDDLLLDSLEKFSGFRIPDRSVAKRRFNANPSFTFPSPENWSQSMHSQFDEIAAEMMKTLGYY